MLEMPYFGSAGLSLHRHDEYFPVGDVTVSGLQYSPILQNSLSTFATLPTYHHRHHALNQGATGFSCMLVIGRQGNLACLKLTPPQNSLPVTVSINYRHFAYIASSNRPRDGSRDRRRPVDPRASSSVYIVRTMPTLISMWCIAFVAYWALPT